MERTYARGNSIGVGSLKYGFAAANDAAHKSLMSVLFDPSWLTAASRKRRWLVGVSGGADSVALLHQLLECGFTQLIVCHLNHQLRGKASDQDAKFVAKLAKHLGLLTEIGCADVAALASSQQQSLEAAAREARYHFFATCRKQHRCERLLLGHHADDQVETLMWNFLRGSHGTKGMQIISRRVIDKKVLEIHRPMLGVTRSEVHAWLKIRKIKWREDATNAEPIAIRNRLRNEAIPLLDEIGGRSLAQSWLRLHEWSHENDQLLRWAIDHTSVLDPQGRLHVKALRDLPKALQRGHLFAFLKQAGVPDCSHDLIERCLELLEKNHASHAINLPGGKHLRRKESRLFIVNQMP